MANLNIIVQDANNLNVQVTPQSPIIIALDKSTPGVGIESIVPVTIDTLQYLRITYTNGVIQDVGPLTSTAYFGEAPINITGNIISLDTVGINYGGTGATNATDARTNLSAAKSGANSDITSMTGLTGGISSPDFIQFDTTYATTLTAGQLGWDGNNTLGLGMAGGNVIQKIGEDQFFYCKATAAIAKGQVVMFTGAVGASGVPTGAPATGITDGTYIMGIAAENIANNGFGLVQTFGTLRNVNTNGYADGDILWYNPSVAGGMTNVKPSAPNVKVQMAAVINGGSTGGGTVLIRINAGSTLGGTDSNAQITSPSNGQILTYDSVDAYWKNTSISTGTGISVTASSTGVLTITNTEPSSGGTVTSVSGTAPISSTGGNTPTISISQAGASTDGYLSSTDWNTFNNKGSGSVTSVSGTGTVNGLTLTGTVTTSGSLTLGGTLDLSSPPTIGNTTPNTGKFTTLETTSNAIISNNSANAALRITQTGSGNALVVEDSANPDSTAFVIDTNGKVILGNTVAFGSSLLQTFVESGSSLLSRHSSADTNGASWYTQKTRGTLGSPSAVISGDTIGALNFQGYDGTAFVTAANILAVVDGTPGTNDMPGRLVFSTTADGASSTTERMRIDNAGRVGIGSTALTGYSLRVSRSADSATFQGIGSTGSSTATSTTGTYNFYSTSATSANDGTPYTIGFIRHYDATQSTFNADSTVTNQYGFIANSSLTGATNNYGFYGTLAAATGAWNLYLSGTANNYMAGTLGLGTVSGLDSAQAVRIGKQLTGNTTVYSVNNLSTSASDVTGSHYSYNSLIGTAAAAYTLSNAYHYNVQQGTFGAGSTVTNQIGFNVNANMVNATNNYGFLGSLPSGTGRYNLYMNGTANNYLAGSLWLGSNSQPTIRLDNSLQITGGTVAYGTRTAGAIQSDVTATGVGFSTSLSTAAIAFTLGQLKHFSAVQGTIGAGSTVTSQYGFIAENSLTGATNNYGFLGNIASGTGRYNLYMAGTADNYLAGNVGIGTSSPSGTAGYTTLQISGATNGGVLNLATGATIVGQLYNNGNNVFLSALQTGSSLTLNPYSTTIFQSAGTERMRIDSSGNVGIGTNSPTAKLDVQRLASGTSSTAIVANLTQDGNNTTGKAINATITTNGLPEGVTLYGLYADAYTTGGVSTNYAIYANRGNVVLGATNGNVGIGTSSPSEKFHVVGGASSQYTQGIFEGNSQGAIFLKKTGTNGAFITALSDSSLSFSSNGSTERMRIDTSGNIGVGVSPNPSYPARLNLYDTSDCTMRITKGGVVAASIKAVTSALTFGVDTVAGDTERMRIDSSGNLLVGTTTSIGKVRINGVSSNYGLFFSGFGGGIGFGAGFRPLTETADPITFENNSGTRVGGVSTSSSATSYVTSSDYRLKENIAPMTGALSKVSALKPCTYTWKVDGSSGQGFIAHELQAVVPDCVTGEKDAVDKEGKPVYQGIDVSFLVATLTKAIQELNAKVESLEAQLQGK